MTHKSGWEPRWRLPTRFGSPDDDSLRTARLATTDRIRCSLEGSGDVRAQSLHGR
jgi:hypothetical protein